MSDFPGALPQLPLWVFIATPLFFIFIILATNVRYNLTPSTYIGHGTTIASLIIGFIFLYAMQKFDLMDLNVASITRSLIYLKGVAERYEQPQLIKYLINYSEAFLNFDGGNFSIFIFEKKLAPHITDEETLLTVRAQVAELENVFNQRISGTNLIAAGIWYLVFVIALLLTVIFPLDMLIKKDADAVLLLVLIWLPVATIYTLYVSELNSLVRNMNNVIKVLKA